MTIAILASFLLGTVAGAILIVVFAMACVSSRADDELEEWAKKDG